MMPHEMDAALNQLNRNTLLKRLNEADAFDVDLQPQPGDRLLLSVRVGKQNDETVKYGFEYSQGKWQHTDYFCFDWEQEHEVAVTGKLKNPLL